MIEVNYQIVNEAIQRFCENYPDGGDWGDMMYDYHNTKYEENQLARKFLCDNGILIPWGNDGMLILSNEGVRIIQQFEGKIELYLKYKEGMRKKEQAEHELKIEAHRSNIRFNKWQKVATTICIICTIINLVVVLYQLIK